MAGTEATQDTSPATVTTPGRIMEVGLGFWGSKVLLSAVDLGLFSELAEGALDSEALREKLGLHPRGARDFLDALVALGFLERDIDGRYSNAADADLFLDKAKPSYIGGILEMADARLYPLWGSLIEGPRTGEPQNEAKVGEDFFELLYTDPVRLQQFMHAMTGLSMGASLAIAAKFPWERYKTFVDVGCAEGGLGVELAKAHDHLDGIGFDLPSVKSLFDGYVESAGLTGRLRFQAGDMFADPFPCTDVVTMGHVVHDWSLEQKKELLRKAYESIPDGGAVLVFDAVIDDERRQNAFGLLMSLYMLIETRGGFDYTGADCQGWLKEVGFRKTYVELLAGPDSMVVGLK